MGKYFIQITRPLDLKFIKISYDEITLQLIDYFLKDNCNNAFHCPHYDIIKEGLYHFARKMHKVTNIFLQFHHDRKTCITYF